MLTDELLIDQIRTRLHAELSMLEPPDDLLDRLHRETGARHGRRSRLGRRGPAGDPRGLRWRRGVLATLVSGGVSVGVVLVVVFAIGRSQPAPGSARAALAQAARAAAAGTVAPALARGQAWYTAAVGTVSSQTYSTPNSPLPTLITQYVRVAKWISSDGSEREATVAANGPSSLGNGVPSDAAGFGDWDLGSVRGFPTSQAGVLRVLGSPRTEGYYGYTRGNIEQQDSDRRGFSKLAEAASLLGDEPLGPAARAAVFNAVARLPGLRYLGAIRDPLGRAGVAVAEQTANARPFNVAGPQRYEVELIFDPTTGTVLGSRTIALAVPGLHLKPGTVLFSWAYTLSRVVRSSSYTELVDALRAEQPMVVRALAPLRAARRRLSQVGQPCHGVQRPVSGSGACRRALLAAERRYGGPRRAVSQRLHKLWLTPPPAVHSSPR